jgi:hypothetical protein
MSKELIVSVNGREKKIAIIENGKVTEFYIERGEDGQGIVGNIYKGRVMRVLPGMQSAFVDIGLERDASSWTRRRRRARTMPPPHAPPPRRSNARASNANARWSRRRNARSPASARA